MIYREWFSLTDVVVLPKGDLQVQLVAPELRGARGVVRRARLGSCGERAGALGACEGRHRPPLVANRFGAPEGDNSPGSCRHCLPVQSPEHHGR